MFVCITVGKKLWKELCDILRFVFSKIQLPSRFYGPINNILLQHIGTEDNQHNILFVPEYIYRCKSFFAATTYKNNVENLGSVSSKMQWLKYMLIKFSFIIEYTLCNGNFFALPCFIRSFDTIQSIKNTTEFRWHRALWFWLLYATYSSRIFASCKQNIKLTYVCVRVCVCVHADMCTRGVCMCARVYVFVSVASKINMNYLYMAEPFHLVYLSSYHPPLLHTILTSVWFCMFRNWYMVLKFVVASPLFDGPSSKWYPVSVSGVNVRYLPLIT